MVKSNKLTNLIFFFIICLIGIYLRIYQINFDDYWSDEIATFWVANPELSFSETLNRNYNLYNGIGLFFNLILSGIMLTNSEKDEMFIRLNNLFSSSFVSGV